MQTRKDEIEERILDAARQEFMDNGFDKASIRNITAAAKTSKSNIYNYFADKDALFRAVVEDTRTGIQTGFEKIRRRNAENTAGYSMEAQGGVMLETMTFVFEHEEDIRLLLFKSSGSSLAGFRDHVTDGLAQLLSNWVSASAPEKCISDLFFKTVAGFYVGAMEQMLARRITPEQGAEQFNVFLKFIYGGWSAVLNN